MNILTVVGARPQIIKSAAISRCIANQYNDRISELVVHTGQHYDAGLSANFYEELKLKPPAVHLSCGKGGPAEQLGAMISALAEVMRAQAPAVVLVYGDTTSTLAGALAAAQVGIPLAHVEAGLRSYNKTMPEERNRVLTDHLSTYLFCPTEAAIKALAEERLYHHEGPPSADRPWVYRCGDVMYDNALHYSSFRSPADVFREQGIAGDEVILATLHRASNTANSKQVMELLQAVAAVGRRLGIEVLMPMHPRTLQVLGLELSALKALPGLDGLVAASPMGYTDILACIQGSALVITDSGGLQKEAAFGGVCSAVLRSETEWVELEAAGVVKLCDLNSLEATAAALVHQKAVLPPGAYGQGDASEKIVLQLLSAVDKN